MFKRIDHVEILPSDYARTMTFYTDVLGFEVTACIPVNMPPLRAIAYARLGDTVIEFLDVENPAPRPDAPMTVGYVGLALEVDSMDAAVAYLAERGVGITWGPMDLGDSIRAEIRDPDGLTIELREWKRS
jgi:catechol 2,3-dioxygenase-like lactoylglutathione lyase family enzyme